MLHAAGALTPSDVVRLARLHESTLRSSVFGRTGARLLARYYQWTVRSPAEYLFVVRHENVIAGAAVLSFQPATLLQRFVLAEPVRFGMAVAWRMAGDAVFRKEVAAYVRERLSAGPDEDAGPELVQIFVDPAGRRRSVGSALLNQVADLLVARGLRQYCVRTLLNDNSEVLEFYKRRGFRPLREMRFCGEPYLLLTWHGGGSTS
jgi:ribosomal protein S18 acetylase RimI-like enzyme